MSTDPLKSGDLFANVPGRLEEEQRAVLAELPGARIERIVSTGQASPEGFWYDQDSTEFVVVLSGSGGASHRRRSRGANPSPRRLARNPAARAASGGLDRRRRANGLARRAREMSERLGDFSPACSSLAA
jgi:hypothetical protein